MRRLLLTLSTLVALVGSTAAPSAALVDDENPSYVTASVKDKSGDVEGEVTAKQAKFLDIRKVFVEIDRAEDQAYFQIVTTKKMKPTTQPSGFFNVVTIKSGAEFITFAVDASNASSEITTAKGKAGCDGWIVFSDNPEGSIIRIPFYCLPKDGDWSDASVFLSTLAKKKGKSFGSDAAKPLKGLDFTHYEDPVD